jgi:uncharacterized protein
MDELSLLGFKFESLKLEQRRLLDDFLKKHPQPLTGYTFATLAAWNSLFQYAWVFAEPEVLLVSCILEPDQHRHLMQPLGKLTVSISQNLLDGAAALPYPLKIIGVSEYFREQNPDFVKSFRSREDRAGSNYLYGANLLFQLHGRKYAKKRNLLAQASGLYRWSVEKLTGATADSCLEVLNSIQREEHPLVEGMLAKELAALDCTLRHFDEFGQQGLFIVVNGRPVAFSIFEAISSTTVAVHFERALRSYKGLYQVVNWETAKIVAAQGYQFINREEDLGDPGLRDAKLSYYPIQIVPAYELDYLKL